MSEGSSWYDSGYNGLKKEEDRLAQLNGPDRFWMPSGGKKQFLFVDDDPFCIHEHNPKIDGTFKNWLTCLSGVSEDIVCCNTLGLNSRYYVGYYTVVDLSEYIDKKGNKYQYGLKFLPAKMKTLKKFRRKKEERGSLVGCIYSAVREDDKSPGVGDEFEFVREADMSKLFALANYKGKKLPELFAAAQSNPEQMERLKMIFNVSLDAEGKLVQKIPFFNYMKLLEPKSSKDLKAMLGSAKIERDDGSSQGGGSTASTGTADENVPF